MRERHPGSSHLPIGVLLGVALFVTPVPARDLTFEERVAAQQAIERVYYEHQLGATIPFEQAVPRGVLERKVQDYLQKSAALELQWRSPVTEETLRAELERMARDTRMPERLTELYDALGRDAFLIEECLARAILVDRLAHNFFAYDQSLHAEERQAAEALRAELVSGRLDPFVDHPARTETEEPAEGIAQLEQHGVEVGPVIEERGAFVIRIVLERMSDRLRVARFAASKKSWDDWWIDAAHDFDVSSIDVVASGEDPLPSPAQAAPRSCVDDDTWDNGALDDVPDGLPHRTAVWTGSRMVIWGGGDSVNTGGLYDPATDSWALTSTINAPSPRSNHTAIWTGRHMVVWGGYDGGTLNSGGVYDPATDSWSPTSASNAPISRHSHSAVWTGSRMVIWGGYANGVGEQNSGARYDPEHDTWTPTSTIDAPQARQDHTAVWTGSVMIVWGGLPTSSTQNTGGRYDPETDSWTRTSTTNAPTPRYQHTAVWSGSVMVVWGGRVSLGSSTTTNTGGRYDPLTDTWTSTAIGRHLQPRSAHTAVWTGSRMVIWGGALGNFGTLDSGALYDPQADLWTPTSVLNAPTPRYRHTAVWTGTQMIVWGGYTNSGGRYDPATDSWTPTSIGSAPTARTGHTAVWTGSRMVVWGGGEFTGDVTGDRYDPATDSWAAISTIGAPTARGGHTAVWTGNRMVIWGGETSPNTVLNTGGRYDPLLDSWTPTSTVNVPAARTGHTAIWTGSRMVVWGGAASGSGLNSGGRYDPTTDSWTPTSTINAPEARTLHTAVWTGNRMVVWGGHFIGPTFILSLNTGGRYNPFTDSWTPTSTVSVPQRRGDHTAVWTGNRMVVWGGVYFEFDFGQPLDSGGRYDPATDSWVPTSGVNAPSARSGHTAVWTGNRMIVWGGGFDNTGRRYDPATDSWKPTSIVNAPVYRTDHTAVWAGGSMLVWGGTGGGYVTLASGGRYALGQAVDDDGDGLSECQGDCNDTDPEVFAVPAEIENLRWASSDLLTWSWAAASSGQGTLYDAMYGDLAQVSNFGTGSADTCMADNIGHPLLVDHTPQPAAGEAWFFLVRGDSICGRGRWETATDGSDRQTTVCP